MAQVVDVMREARAAFGKFAEQYLEIPDNFYRAGVMPAQAADAVARYLVESGVLSRVEIDLALERMKIVGVVVY